MSIGIYRRVTASTLLAGSLCLLAATAEAAPASHPGSSRQAAVVSPSGSGSHSGSYWGNLWTQLVHLFASDHHGAASGGYDGHGHGDPDNDEGPGMCPHGR